MLLLKKSGKTLSELKEVSFKLEKNIQQLFEENLPLIT